jgi:hypothetical protein
MKMEEQNLDNSQNPQLNIGAVSGMLLADVKQYIKNLTSDERLDLFADYCKYCGDYDGDTISGCQCWNDE